MMNKLAATTLESKFHVFDVRTQHPEKGFASLSEKVTALVLNRNNCQMQSEILLTTFKHQSVGTKR